MTEHADLVIAGGTIVDGTGAPRRDGTVVVVDGRIRVLRPEDAAPAHVVQTIAATDRAAPPPGGQTSDAAARVVAPGFIDLHSHGALVILEDGRHEPKVRQGVTTELVGVDGNGFAPYTNRAAPQAFVQ